MERIGTQIIETQRLTLRKFSMEDVMSVYQNWASDESVQKSYGEPVYATPEETAQLLEKYIADTEQKKAYRWAILLKGKNICIGQIAFFFVDEKNHSAEIEYCIGRKFQNMGFATEATKAVIAYGFEQIKLHTIRICHRSNNLPSKKVIQKCGFHYDGTLRDYFCIDGTYFDRLYYSILNHERKEQFS